MSSQHSGGANDFSVYGETLEPHVSREFEEVQQNMFVGDKDLLLSYDKNIYSLLPSHMKLLQQMFVTFPFYNVEMHRKPTIANI